MNLPFTQEQFLGVFSRYNEAIWPAQVAAYILGIAVIVLVLRRGHVTDRIVSGVLALFWIVNGGLYHMSYFSAINKAAYVFGALFLIQGLLLLLNGVVWNKISFSMLPTVRHALGLLIVLYAVAGYTILGHVFGHRYPASPMFGVAPCPTTIFTFGVLLWAADKMPRYLMVVPLIWALVGTSAAMALGVKEDFGLLASALLAVLFILSTRRQSEKKRIS